ncbi:MAG: iron-sulfur cluster assembly protein [Bacteroidota bacterium]
MNENPPTGDNHTPPVNESVVMVGNREVLAPTELDRKIWVALKECYDPEIPVNIVDLGLVYEMKVDQEIPGESNVFIKMTLTAPGCGMGPMIAGDVKRRVSQVPGVKNVLVELVFDPIWGTSMMSEAAKLMLNVG